MPLARSRDYLSIGEVLEAIRAEFPDVSISKIRFLEAEGLINPERTSSGYRKFFDQDLKRLRYVLSLQRDHFLPLKVIKERLDEWEANGGVEPAAPAPGKKAAAGNGATAAAAQLADVSLSEDELLKASGLDEQQWKGLVDFGIVEARDAGSYDAADLAVARAARGLLEFGLEPRHLRTFKQTTEREAGVLEQLVSPMTRQRSADAQKEAARSLARMVDLARQLRDGLLRTHLRELL